MDHVRGPGIDVECFYFDRALRAYAVSTKQMYSNTPSDFDFKLRRSVHRDAARLTGAEISESETSDSFFPDPASLASHLAARRAVAFPAVHGAFGEDGDLQAVLERAGVPFVGAASAAAAVAFDKALCASALRAAGFPTLRALVLQSPLCRSRHATCATLAKWFEDENLHAANAWVIVKPCGGGSSLGVVAARGVDDAADAAFRSLRDDPEARVLVERHAGVATPEFTVVVLETARGPVALAPTEVEITAETPRNRTEHGGGGDDVDARELVFDFRKKYLPSSRVAYHAPARFGEAGVAHVRRRAEEAFAALGLRDCARLDGFYVRRDDPVLVRGARRSRANGAADAETVKETETFARPGDVFEPVFADVNVASGMEQTSFLFLQAAQAGMSHGAALRGVLASACRREGVPTRRASSARDGAKSSPEAERKKTKVYVLFGGDTSERQVSLTSGVNVWLKLRSRPELDATPVLLAPGGLRAVGAKLEDATVFRLSYASALRHTVEEAAAAAAAEADDGETRSTSRRCHDAVRAALRDGGFFYDETDANDDVGDVEGENGVVKESLRAFASRAAAEDAVVFVAVHGGVGEDGTLQAFFASRGVAFTGSGAAASRLCMDKNATGAALAAARLEGVTTCRKQTLTAWEMSEALAKSAKSAASVDFSDARAARDPLGAWWETLVAAVGGSARDGLCIKPNSDGCSTGVARLRSSADLWQYASAVTRGAATAAVGDQSVAMPSPPPFAFVVEPFVVASAVEVFFDARAGTERVRFKPTVSSDDSRDENDSIEKRSRRYVEITAGVVAGALGAARCLPPSATVAERACAVLSLEEKFQGGTGVNLTPVPPELIEREVLRTVRRRIASAANALGIEGFARVDAFVDARTGDIVVIEANTVPGMTPSTALFHQALADVPSVEPAAFLALAVEHAVRRRDERPSGTYEPPGVEETR